MLRTLECTRIHFLLFSVSGDPLFSLVYSSVPLVSLSALWVWLLCIGMYWNLLCKKHYVFFVLFPLCEKILMYPLLFKKVLNFPLWNDCVLFCSVPRLLITGGGKTNWYPGPLCQNKPQLIPACTLLVMAVIHSHMSE